MDPASQGFLGAAVVQSILKDKDDARLWIVALLAAMAPDLDILIRSSTNPLLFIQYHRHFTHSLIFIPIGGLLVGCFFLCFKRFRAHPKQVILASILGYATHGLLDACTSYGTLLYWPFSDKRAAFDIISIVDPLFTLPLILGVAFSVIYSTQKWARLALFVCALYLGFCTWQHHRAIQQQYRLADSRHQTLQKHRVTPTLGHVFHWRSLYIGDQNIYLDEIDTPLLDDSASQSGIVLPQTTEANLPDSIQQNPHWLADFKIFNWFCDGYVSEFASTPLTLADVRYLIKRQTPLEALWGIEFPETTARQHVYWRRMISKKP